MFPLYITHFFYFLVSVTLLLVWIPICACACINTCTLKTTTRSSVLVSHSGGLWFQHHPAQNWPNVLFNSLSYLVQGSFPEKCGVIMSLQWHVFSRPFCFRIKITAHRSCLTVNICLFPSKRKADNAGHCQGRPQCYMHRQPSTRAAHSNS